MRSFLLLLTILLISIPAAAQDGIKGAKQPGPVKADVFNDRGPAKPRRGGEIVQTMLAGFRSLDSEQDNSASTSEVVRNYILDNLVDGDVETWEPIPRLAERWDVRDVVELKDGKIVRGTASEADGKVNVKTEGEAASFPKGDVKEIRFGTSLTFYLRKGVVFHNGDPFTAKDVAFTYKLLSHPKNGMPNIQGYFEKITECKVIDDFTVRLTYSEQYWLALKAAGGLLYIRPHKAWDPQGLLDKDPDAYFKTFDQHPLMLNPIGTGPYQFESFKKDFEVVLKRFDGHWDKANPQYPDKIRFRIIKDPVAQLQALKNGEVDFVTMVPPDIFDDFFTHAENRKNLAQVEIVYPTYGYIGFNMRKDLWKDKKVRWAISYGSFDINKFIKEVLKGRAERTPGDTYLYSPSHNPELKPIPFDLKKAEELLAEAGWYDSDGDGILDKDGKKFEFELLTRDMPPTMPVIQQILQMQANLKKLGIKMELRKLEWTAFLDKIEVGDFDVCRLAWALSSPPTDHDPFQIWHSSSIGKGGSNHVAYANPEADKLIVAMRRELDEKKRRELELKFQKVLYDDQPYIWLYMPAELRAYNKKWRGVRFWVPRPCHNLCEWYLGD